MLSYEEFERVTDFITKENIFENDKHRVESKFTIEYTFDCD